MKFASNLLTVSCIFQPTFSLNPDLLIDHISEEADCLTAWHKRDGTSKGKADRLDPRMKCWLPLRMIRVGTIVAKASAATAARKGTGHESDDPPRRRDWTRRESLRTCSNQCSSRDKHGNSKASTHSLLPT